MANNFGACMFSLLFARTYKLQNKGPSSRWCHLAYRTCGCNLKLIISKIHIKDRCLKYFPWNRPQVNDTRPPTWFIKIGPVNGLLTDGTKPLSQSLATRFYDAIWRSYATMSRHCNALINKPWSKDKWELPSTSLFRWLSTRMQYLNC